MKFSVEKRDITPREPVYLAGFGSRDHKSEGVLQPVTARTVLLQANKTLLVIALDVIGADRSFITDIKAALNERFGLAEDEVLINASHTHSSVYLTGLTPELRLGLYSMGRDDYPINESEIDYAPDEAYFVFLRDTLLEMVATCYGNLQEGALRVANSHIEFSVSRRLPLGGGRTDYRPNPQAEIDEELFVYQLVDSTGRLSCLIYSIGSHPTTLGAYCYQICNDYVGFCSEALEERFPGATAVFLQGCGAELKPRTTARDGQFVGCTVDDVRQTGRSLADGVIALVESNQYHTVRPEFRTALTNCSLPTRREDLAFYHHQVHFEPGSYESRSAADMLIAHLEGRARKNRDLYVAVWQFDSETHLVAIEGEVSTEYALTIKQYFGNGHMAVIGYTNGVQGYIPTRKMLGEGGYEAENNYFYKLQGPFLPEIEDIIIGRVAALLHSVRQ